MFDSDTTKTSHDEIPWPYLFLCVIYHFKLRVCFLKVLKKEYHTCVSLLGRGFMTWAIGGLSVLAI
jgi:hypothetical protein